MKQLRKPISYFSLLAKAALASALLSAPLAQADSVGQVQTTKYFAPETVAMLKQRVQDVANGVPGATMGFKQGDTVSYIIQFTPVANAGTIGAGGYITDYIPTGTQVAGAWFVQPDGLGGFYQVSPPAPAQMDDGWGASGQGAFAANWTNDPYTISTCTAAGKTLANCSGSLSQLYADTGIFYSTDPRTTVFSDPGTDGRVMQWSAPTGNGYNACPTRGMTQLVTIMGGTVTTCAPGGVSTHNFWDAAMTSAFGTTAANLTLLAALPRTSGNLAINNSGAGVPPFNSGSPVAGPDSGYQLDYTGNVGPWNRIYYPGSMVGSNAFVPITSPATITGTPAVVATPTSAGVSFPLPTTTTAVRWAAGRLVVGSQSFVKISLVLTAPPPGSGLVNNSEVFGGDESPEGGGGNRDSAWVYHVPSVASNVSTLYILKQVVCVYDSTGTCVPSNGADIPTTGTPATVGPKVRYRITYINTNNGTQHNVTICDQLPNMTPQGQAQITFASGVTQININPNIGAPTSPAAAQCNFGAGGTTFSYPTIPVLAGGGSGIIDFDVQYPVLTANTIISNQAKAVSNEIPAGVTSYSPSNVLASLAATLRISKIVSTSTPNKGDTVTYTIAVDNTGGSAATLTTLTDKLNGVNTAIVASQAPSRINYVSTGAITINGSPLSGVAVLDTLPPTPATANNELVTWTFPSGTTIPAGGQLVVSFNVTVGDATANNLMAYGTAYPNLTTTINCPNCGVTAVTVSNTAPVTPTVPGLQLTKSIDCIFSGGVCTAGSYVAGSSIPPGAELRYKIAYYNPALAAQTITLSDTLPASTTSAGNLYVASGPDIRPSTPALSVNPAAAGAPRGVDAALTAIAGSSVVTFSTVSLPGVSSGALYLDVQTNAAAAAVVTNTASIQSAQRAAAGSPAVTSAVSATAAALVVTKSASVSSVAPGGTVSYTVSVTNTTGAAITLTSLADTLPLPTAGTITYTSTTSVTLNGTVLSGASLPTVGTAGQTTTWTFKAAANTLNAGGTLTLVFIATYSTTVPRGVTYNNNATLNYTGGVSTTGPVAPVTVPYNSLSIAKAVVAPAPATITPNSAVTYAITVTNTGTTPAPVTSVVDTLPSSPTGTIAYTSTTSVLVNGVAQTGVAGAPAAGQYQNPAPLAAVAGTRQVVTWTLPAAGTSIPAGATMVITFVVQYGTVTTGVIYTNDVQAKYTGGATTSISGTGLAPVNVPLLSSIVKTVDCVYTAGVCTPGSYVDGTPIPVNAMLGYKIVYGNLSALAATGVTITDILPAQVGANAISNLVVNGVATAAPGNAAGGGTVTLLSGATLNPFNTAGSTGTITFAVQTTVTAGAGVTNTATITTTQDPLGQSSSITEAATGANLTVSKAVTTGTPSTVAQGGTASYTITVTNNGAASATLNSLVDTLPGVANAAGATWRFNYAATGAMTLNGAATAPAYTLATTIPPAPGTANNEVDTWTFTGGLVIPAGQTFTLTFTALVGSAIPNTTPGITYYNNITANYTGGVYPSSTALGQAPVFVPFSTLTMVKTINCVYSGATCIAYTPGSPVPPNALLRYQLAYSNLLPSPQTVTVNDTLPASTTAAGNLYVGSGPDVRPSTPVLSVNAAAAGAARGPDVALTPIAGGTAVRMTAASLPANSSGTLFIDVQTNAAQNTSFSNCASISTVSTDTCATAGVVKSTAAVNVLNVALLTIGKTTSTPTVYAGVSNATYTITITNTGSAPTTSLKVYDFLPFSGAVAAPAKQFTYVAGSSTYGNSGGAAALPVPAITTSTPPTIAPYASSLNQQQVLWDFGNYSLAVGGTVTITFNAAVGSAVPAATYTNSAREEYASSGISLNANLDNAAPVIVAANLPSLTFLKTVSILSDPINGATNPKFIPGAVALYTLIATNSGTGSVDNNTTVITDATPANTALFVNDIGVAGSGPVLFSQGATSSTLTYGFTALNSATDNLDFSKDNGATWNYTPVPGADGCDPLVTNLRVSPQGTFVGNPTAPSPSFQLVFRVCVK